jgi:RES domain
MYTYDPSLYEIDTLDRQESDASIKDGALLYRVASPTHWNWPHIISGDGTMKKKSVGRFHRIDQRASYCANNVIVCLSEMLYHQYRKFLSQVEANQPRDHLDQWTLRKSRLAIFSVKRIDGLVYVDSIGAKSYDARIISSTVVFPDPLYGPLHVISDQLRQHEKSGVVYPSARHSKDFAFAFFKNETSKIKRGDFYEAPLITLQLIVEEQDTSYPPTRFRVHTDKLHATMGHYEFDDPDHFEALKDEGLIYPKGIPASGYIDFVRRHYTDYPKCAVCPRT